MLPFGLDLNCGNRHVKTMSTHTCRPELHVPDSVTYLDGTPIYFNDMWLGAAARMEMKKACD